jgi:hypothetical protein
MKKFRQSLSMKSFSVIILFFICLLPVFAQDLNGVVFEQETDIPVSYVSIGIINKTGGTYSDNEGKFHFVQSEYDKKDSLRFSCIGYKSVTFSLTDLIKEYGEKNMNVYLQKEVFRLKGVDIFPAVFKEKVIGNKLSNRHICICAFDDVEGGIVIRNEKRIFLDNVTFKLSSESSPLPDSVLIRFNIYTVENDLPAKTILEKPIYFFLTKELKDFEILVHLEKYRIVATGDFAATIEIIRSYGNGKICFAGWITGNPTVFKYGKQGKWAYPVDDKKQKLKIYQSIYLGVRVEK